MECAFITPFIVACLLATIQIAVIHMGEAYLETIAERAVRLVQASLASALSQSQFLNQICGARVALFNCNDLIVYLEPAPYSVAGIPSAFPQFDANGNLLNPTKYTIAGPPPKLMIIVMCRWPVVSGPLNFNISNLEDGSCSGCYSYADWRSTNKSRGVRIAVVYQDRRTSYRVPSTPQ